MSKSSSHPYFDHACAVSTCWHSSNFVLPFLLVSHNFKNDDSFHAELVYAANTTFQVNEDESNYDEADFHLVPNSQLYNHHYAAYDFTQPGYGRNKEVYERWVRQTHEDEHEYVFLQEKYSRLLATNDD